MGATATFKYLDVPVIRVGEVALHVRMDSYSKMVLASVKIVKNITQMELVKFVQQDIPSQMEYAFSIWKHQFIVSLSTMVIVTNAKEGSLSVMIVFIASTLTANKWILHI